MDELGSGLGDGHTSSPIEGLRAPQRGEDHLAVDGLAEALLTMAGRALLRKDLSTATKIRSFGGYRQSRQTLPRRPFPGRQPLGEEVRIALERDEDGITQFRL